MSGRDRNEHSRDETHSSVLLGRTPPDLQNSVRFICKHEAKSHSGMTTSEFRETLTARLHILRNAWLARGYPRALPAPRLWQQ
jgi:hypothetical protein